MTTFSEWRPFPDPRKCECLVAPFGPGCYQLRNRVDGGLVLFGQGANVAYRMSSLLPAPFGAGTRRSQDKRQHVLKNLAEIEYRTIAFGTPGEAMAYEKEQLKSHRSDYLFKT